MGTDYTPTLRALMHRAGLRSFAQLCRQTGLARSQIWRLRRGEIQQLPIASVIQFCGVLQISMIELWEQFTTSSEAVEIASILGPPSEISRANSVQESEDLEWARWKAEYERLQLQLERQRQSLLQEFQQETVLTLESLLLQWPTAAYAAQQHPQAPAVKLLPLLRPLEQLLQAWQVEVIGAVGEVVAYDPRWQQVMPSGASGSSEPVLGEGDPVRVRYVGYRQGDRLLYRAKVSVA
jgi:molecular chaperone GrpE (heat shock protein)